MTVIDELAARAGFGVVWRVSLDRTVTTAIENEALPDVLKQLLGGDSYLFASVPPVGDSMEARPQNDTLWIFADGVDAAMASAIAYEAILWHGNYAEKKQAIRGLRDIGTAHATATLSLALNDDDSRVADGALEALADIRSDESLAAIASMALTDGDAGSQCAAVNALSLAGTDSALDYLTIAMADPDPRVRMAVLDALADIPRQRAVAAIRHGMQDVEPDVRRHAQSALEDSMATIAFDAALKARR